MLDLFHKEALLLYKLHIQQFCVFYWIKRLFFLNISPKYVKATI